MDENKNKIPKDKDGDDDHADHHQNNGSPSAVNEEPSDQATQVENRDLGNERMLSTIELLERLEVTIRGRFLVTMLRDQKVGSSTVKGSDGYVRITHKGKFINTEVVENETDQGAGSSVGKSSSNDHARNYWKSRIGKKGLLSLEALDQSLGALDQTGDRDILDVLSEAIRNVAFGNTESGSQGAVTQKGGSSDQDSVVPPPVNPMPRSGEQDSMEIASNANMNVGSGNQESGSQGAVTQKGSVFGPVIQKGGSSDQDNMEKKPNAKRNVRSGDDPHQGEASDGEESEDDMEVDRDAKRAKK